MDRPNCLIWVQSFCEGPVYFDRVQIILDSLVFIDIFGPNQNDLYSYKTFWTYSPVSIEQASLHNYFLIFEDHIKGLPFQEALFKNFVLTYVPCLLNSACSLDKDLMIQKDWAYITFFREIFGFFNKYKVVILVFFNNLIIYKHLSGLKKNAYPMERTFVTNFLLLFSWFREHIWSTC